MRKYLVIMVLLALTTISLPVYASSYEETLFIETLTDYMDDYTGIINDMTADFPYTDRYLDDLYDLSDDISNEALPNSNTPLYDILQYALIQAVDTIIIMIENDNDQGLLTDSMQYLSILRIIAGNSEQIQVD